MVTHPNPVLNGDGLAVLTQNQSFCSDNPISTIEVFLDWEKLPVPIVPCSE